MLAPMRTLQRFGGPRDQILAGLGQHGDLHVVGDAVLDDQLAHEVEVGLGGGREPDLDLLVAHLDQQFEHLQLAGRRHRIDECLVPVAQVGGQPAGGVGDLLVGPGAIRNAHRLEGRVAVERHGAGLLHRLALLRTRASGDGGGGHGDIS
jgi:hypothetical protein